MYAAYARLLSSFSLTRFELLIHTQGTNEDFRKWAVKLKKVIAEHSVIIESEFNGILNEGIENNKFLSKELRLNAISSCIMHYTSSTEYFLVDLIKFKLQNKKLFKKALNIKNISINKFDIAEFDTINELREKYITILSNEFSFGTLWTKKLQNSSKLFDIAFDKNSSTIKSAESIWEQRNKFAHLNRIGVLPISFLNLEGKVVEIDDLSDDDKYFDFCIELINVMNKNLELLGTFQQSVMDKWVSFDQEK